MKRAAVVAILLALLIPAADGGAHAATNPPASKSDELAGLWKAERHFGPAARGMLTIERTSSGWTADFIGHVSPVSYEKSLLKFALPNGGGSFTGQLQHGGITIAGHWIQPNSVIHGFQTASPVRLAASGTSRWRGLVDPFHDDCTLFLMLRKRPDGTLDAYLRNPDRNFGFQYGIDRLVRDGAAITLMGRMWEKGPETEQFYGRFDAGTKTLSIVFPNQGGIYDFAHDDDLQSGFYPRGRVPVHYTYRAPPLLNDGWLTGTLNEAKIDRADIEKFVQTIVDMPIESVHTPEVEAILVARHGKLVMEEYFHGFDRYTLHDTRSAGKSLSATVVGAAIQAGAPLALSMPVYKLMNGGTYPANLSPWKRTMTLQDLLTMRSGYYCNDSDPASPGNEDTMLNQTAEPDYYRYVLKVPMVYAPDTVSVYCSTNPNLALGMVGRATGESQLDTFDRLIGGPLKIDHYAWPLDGVGHPYGGGGVRIRPRDYLKIGQMMLNGGTWQGHRILGRDFVARASAPLHDLNMIQYGYLWWSINFPYKNRSVRAFFAGGNGGQGIMVVPELDLVIGTFAGNYADHVGLHIQQDFVPNYILPAVREPGDDPNEREIPHDFKTPYAHPPFVVPTSLQN